MKDQNHYYLNIQIDGIFSFNVFNKCVKAHAENERTEAVTLQYSSSDKKERGTKIACSNGCLKIGVESTN